MSRFIAVGAVAAASVLLLAGCATSSAGSGSGAVVWDTPSPPAGEVSAQGTVMDVDGTVELCLGAIAESYPPQCSGIPVEGWSWDGIEGWETSGDVTWGAYAVRGTYDGSTFAVTGDPVMLALYDPIAPADPTGGKPGTATGAELTEMQDALPALIGDGFLASYPENGWLWVDVVWDDGTLQAAADETYGEGAVVVRSAIRPFD
ncbi:MULTISPECIES: hypothetical protein [unclassified Microbacterium]|uniref:hypothetical protein n=1 Tax=unclassified Microbacterium TaxID=2609290 RepID=UPI000C2BC150|nr:MULTISPECIES: hypothetical protein [unclassified Microbacterium]